jgi:hypothetical protein
MFSNARFQQGLRRRRWRRLSTCSFGEEKRCSHPWLYQVEQAKRETWCGRHARLEDDADV